MGVTTEDLQVFPESVTIGGLAMHRVVYVNGQLVDVSESQRILRVGEGFDWGYKGSAPAQLALAVLWHFLSQVEADKKEQAKQLAISLYKAFNLVLIKQLPQMNFEIQVQLRKLLYGLTGLSTEPISVMFLYTHNILDKGDTIAAFRYATNHREVVVLPDQVENKVGLKRTEDGAYTLDDEF